MKKLEKDSIMVSLIVSRKLFVQMEFWDSTEGYLYFFMAPFPNLLSGK